MSEDPDSVEDVEFPPQPQALPSPTENLQEIISEQLQENMLGAEFLVGLFWSAMNSFRHDSILRPFPSMFVEGRDGGREGMEGEGHKDIEGLVSKRGRGTSGLVSESGRGTRTERDW